MPIPQPARALLVVALLTGVAAVKGPAAPPTGAQVNPRALAAELGCGACHAGMPDPAPARAGAPALGEGAEPLPGDFVFAYLGDPQRRRTDIGRTRMPDFRLDEGERVALALYLGRGEPTGAYAAATRRHPEASAEVGSRIFGTLGCAGCHDVDGHAPELVGPDLSQEGARARTDWLRAYLASPVTIRGDGHPARPGARMPDFRLDTEEVEALTPLLAGLGSPEPWTPEPLTPFQMRRTERLVRHRLACLGCHTLGGEGGGIGPPLDGLAERLHPSFVRAVVSDPAGVVPGSGMPRQHLEVRDADRVTTYLIQRGGDWSGGEHRSLADSAHPAHLAARARAATGGGALYLRHCAACHGTGGRGDGFNAPLLPVPPSVHASAELMARRPDDSLFDGIHAGAYVLDGSPRMPPFGEMLGPEQIRSLVGYIRELCACREPDWARDGRVR